MKMKDIKDRLAELEESGVIDATKEARDARIKFMVSHGITKERIKDSQRLFTLQDTMAARSIVSEKISSMLQEVDDQILNPLPSEVLNVFIEELPEDQRETAIVYAMLGMSVNISFAAETEINRFITLVEVLKEVMDIPENQQVEALTTYLLRKMSPAPGEESGAGVSISTPLGEVNVDQFVVDMTGDEKGGE